MIQRIFREHYPRYRQEHRLSWRERWAAHNICTCRTAAQGTHVAACPTGDFREVRFNSCKHRGCALCGAPEVEAWVRARQAQALACRYYHIVFTVPDVLHDLWRYNRRLFTNLLCEAGWQTLKELLADPKWLGGLPGAIGAFQSWGETLNVHAHAHFLVTAGGLGADGRWRVAGQEFLLPVRVVRDKFRGKFLARLRAAVERGELSLPPSCRRQQALNRLNALGRRKWNVRIQPPYEHPNGVLKYLAAYLRRGPISERRIRRYAQGRVRIAYKRPGEHGEGTFELTAPEFVGRVLTHVPPKGLRMVREYGLFHHQGREELAAARGQIGPTPEESPEAESRRGGGAESNGWRVGGAGECPRCGRALRVTRVRYPARDSPYRRAA